MMLHMSSHRLVSLGGFAPRRLLLGGLSVANAAEPMVGIRSLAMGDSMRAMATQSEAMLLNPAGLALSQQFQVTGFTACACRRSGTSCMRRFPIR